MKAVVTRVNSASVEIEEKINGSIGRGFLVLLGIAPDDTESDVEILAEKICNCRIFSDEKGKMNLNLETVGGSLLVISQFTLFADLKSRRPSFSGAGKPSMAIPLYEKFLELCRLKGFVVQHGEFGADMKVVSENDGPVTLIFDTSEWRK
ncbi:MAG: D-tyrosyl-tRNA(Tyr) deacylase [Anaerovibrio sp.]|uniref:D-aminoacyl-tRNA deacylase n=1 Tax=Anaerovibrio sp. TaxID=1872532 RepID=UPI0025E4BF8E|nr:D-aminoacyl-tRNA deacylase [Anaerovibrio sp.]MCR5176705.1 D-tyrosyl-tRNA(Tyr) deacylase [Anaerovibrio sp.]